MNDGISSEEFSTLLEFMLEADAPAELQEAAVELFKTRAQSFILGLQAVKHATSGTTEIAARIALLEIAATLLEN
jgi:hypothetical protein